MVRNIRRYMCYIFRIVMPCSSNPCIIPSVNDPVVKSSVCVTGGQTLISNADGGECAVWATARGSLLCVVLAERQEARTRRESHWMWQCCETNLQQHSKWITEAEAWCLGKDRLLVCVSMCSCVYSMWERLMLHSRVQYSFVCTCSRRIFLLCNVSTTAIWIAVHIDLISSGCILTSHLHRNGWHHSTASEHLLKHRTCGVCANKKIIITV